MGFEKIQCSYTSKKLLHPVTIDDRRFLFAVCKF